tara:strand:+ start:369 stop:752 length:384 start_codon:yes stop_codon:yes gene_type:complete
MSTIKANTLLHSDGTTTTQPSIPALDQRMAKAWVSFDMTNFNIRNSYNTSSCTDIATGRFRINFTNALPSANHAWVGAAGNFGSTTGTGRDVSLDGAMTTTTLLGRVTHTSTTVTDDSYVSVIVFSS